jgi:hypothetical protein
MNQIGIPYVRAKSKDYFEQLGGGLSSDVEEGLLAGQLQVFGDHVRRTISDFATLGFDTVP